VEAELGEMTGTNTHRIVHIYDMTHLFIKVQITVNRDNCIEGTNF